MATENRLWGAERIRGELLKLGVRVAKRTVQRYMRGASPVAPRPGRRWRTFLRNHTVWACDFLQTYDVWLRPVFAFFIVDVNARGVVHLAVTRAPTQAWTAQQLRNATPFGQGPQVVIRDQDDKFGVVFDRVAEGAGVRVLRTAVRTPLMNSVCERFLGNVRRECLDHLIILSAPHLRHVLPEYCVSYFNLARPHQGMGQRIPIPAEHLPTPLVGSVTAMPCSAGFIMRTAPRRKGHGRRKEPAQGLSVIVAGWGTASPAVCARPELEPWTYGLKDRSETESSPEVRCDRDRVVTFADSLLRQAAEGGAVPREDAEMLAREWLTISGADLAMGVLMGGRHEAAQLIELCGCVLRTTGVVCEPTNMAEDDANGRRP